jgi:hypothetical protein
MKLNIILIVIALSAILLWQNSLKTPEKFEVTENTLIYELKCNK